MVSSKNKAITSALLFTALFTGLASASLDTRELKFSDLTSKSERQLRGTTDYLEVPFSIRRDEVARRAWLELNAVYSPALLRNLSHLRVRVNGETVRTLGLDVFDAASKSGIDTKIEIDPRLLGDYNRVEVGLIGHYTLECEDAMHSSLWADIGGSSRLMMEFESLPLRPDLKNLPRPFFDPLDASSVKLSFAMTRNPSMELLHSAGILASWFGSMADYRGAEFSVHLGDKPLGHSVVVATNAELPQWLAGSEVEMPSIRLLSLEKTPQDQILLIQGKDAEQLKTAVLALTMAPDILSGVSVQVDSFAVPPERKAYDSPNWVPTDREVSLGDLVDFPEQLQGRGHKPKPIQLDLNLPPDLMTWNSRGVPISLLYRYTPPVESDNSALSVSINDQFLHAVRLRANGENRLRVPLLNSTPTLAASDLKIPAFQIGTLNRLSFEFALDYHSQDRCTDTRDDMLKVAIDEDSSLDFSGFAHYAAMPNLSLYAASGFPFSKYADLKNTAVVLSDGPAASAEIRSMLFHLGRLGAITGAIGHRFVVVQQNQLELVEDRDLLMIGLPDSWQKYSPVQLSHSARALNGDELNIRVSAAPDIELASSEVVNAGPAFTAKPALVGFQSPLQEGLSVVALAVADASELQIVDQALKDAGLRSQINGDLNFVDEHAVSSMALGETYYVGSLPWHRWIWYHLSRYPTVLAILTWGTALLMAVLIFWLLRRRAVAQAKA